MQRFETEQSPAAEGNSFSDATSVRTRYRLNEDAFDDDFYVVITEQTMFLFKIQSQIIRCAAGSQMHKHQCLIN